MKKAFTLLEVVISISIFMIILLFLYKNLDDTKVFNEKFEQFISKSDDKNLIYKIIAEDIAESKNVIEITEDKDRNSLVIFKSSNSFNNPFFTNITYMISSNSNLLRIESKEKFQKEKSGMAFYNNSFIDILYKDVKKFYVLNKDDKYVFIIEPKKGDKNIFTTFKIMEN